MATTNQTNTLNDAIYGDDITRAKQREGYVPPTKGEEYGYVISFFKSIMKDEHAAETFAEALYEVAQATQVNILILMETLKDLDLIQLNRTMAYYLNGIRSPATMLGVQNTVRPNYYAGRNVLS